MTALQPSAAVSRPAGALRRQALLLGRAPRGPLTSAALQCQVRRTGRLCGTLVFSYPLGANAEAEGVPTMGHARPPRCAARHSMPGYVGKEGSALHAHMPCA